MVRSTIPVIDKTNSKRSNAKKEDVPFIVNRDGFPLGEDSWEKMWQFAISQYPDKVESILAVRHSPVLPKVIPPSVPLFNASSVNVWEYTLAVQDYMEKLQYNHTGTQFYEIKKTKCLSGLMETAKSMVDEALPIKCLESVILGVYLTNGVSGLERFPINFKSKFYGKNYYHVVLGIYYMGVYGTLGLSRRSDLMYKPLLYKTLSDLIFDFVECYRRYLHSVVKITIGNYVPHVFNGNEGIVWKGVSLHMLKMSEDYARKEIDKYGRQLRNNTVPEGYYVLKQTLWQPFDESPDQQNFRNKLLWNRPLAQPSYPFHRSEPGISTQMMRSPITSRHTR